MFLFKMGVYTGWRSTRFIPSWKTNRDDPRQMWLNTWWGVWWSTLATKINLAELFSNESNYTIETSYLKSTNIYDLFFSRIADRLEKTSEVRQETKPIYLDLITKTRNSLKDKNLNLNNFRKRLTTILSLTTSMGAEDLLKIFKRPIVEWVENHFKDVSPEDKKLAAVSIDIIRKHELFNDTKDKTWETAKEFREKALDKDHSDLTKEYRGAKSDSLAYNQISRKFEDFQDEEIDEVAYDDIENSENWEYSILRVWLNLYSLSFERNWEWFAAFWVSNDKQMMSLFNGDYQMVSIEDENLWKNKSVYLDINMDNLYHYKKKHILFDLQNEELLIQYRNKVYVYNIMTWERTANSKYWDDVEFLDFANDFWIRVWNDKLSRKWFIYVDYLPWSTLKEKRVEDSDNLKQYIENLSKITFDHEIESAEFSPDGKTLIAISKWVEYEKDWKRTTIWFIYTYDIAEINTKLELIIEELREFEKSLKNQKLSNQEIKIQRDNKKQQLLMRIRVEHKNRKIILWKVNSSDISLNNEILAIWWDAGLYLYNLKTWILTHLIKAKNINSVKLSPDSKSLFIWADMWTLWIYNIETNKIKVIDLKKHMKELWTRKWLDPLRWKIQDIQISPDGETVLIWFSDPEILKISVNN